jgi:hypothetical protein
LKLKKTYHSFKTGADIIAFLKEVLELSNKHWRKLMPQ